MCAALLEALAPALATEARNKFEKGQRQAGAADAAVREVMLASRSFFSAEIEATGDLLLWGLCEISRPSIKQPPMFLCLTNSCANPVDAPTSSWTVTVCEYFFLLCGFIVAAWLRPSRLPQALLFGVSSCRFSRLILHYISFDGVLPVATDASHSAEAVFLGCLIGCDLSEVFLAAAGALVSRKKLPPVGFGMAST